MTSSIMQDMYEIQELAEEIKRGRKLVEQEQIVEEIPTVEAESATDEHGHEQDWSEFEDFATCNHCGVAVDEIGYCKECKGYTDV